MINSDYHFFLQSGTRKAAEEEKQKRVYAGAYGCLNREEKEGLWENGWDRGEEKLWEIGRKQGLSLQQGAGTEDGWARELPGKAGEGKAMGEGKTVNKTVTETKILVKPDGTRVLVVTVRSEGMIRTRSLKLSGPTDMPNKETEDLENVSLIEEGEGV